MRCHVMLDQKTIAFDLADQIRLVPAGVKIAVTDLPVVIRADRIIALANMDQNVHIIRKPLDRNVNSVDCSPDFGVFGGREIWLIDLNMLAPGSNQPLEVQVEQLADVVHHPRYVIVIFVIGDSGQKMQSGHCDFDRPTCKGGYHSELLDQTKVGRFHDRRSADRGRMEDVGIVLADWLWSGNTLERGDLLPEMV